MSLSFLCKPAKPAKPAKLTIIALALSGCQTVGLPADAQFPPVPEDIELCAKSSLVAIPNRDLSAHDVEIMWKADRYVALTKGRCLRRLIIRDNKLAGK